jgi:hypothetical protein
VTPGPGGLLFALPLASPESRLSSGYPLGTRSVLPTLVANQVPRMHCVVLPCVCCRVRAPTPGARPVVAQSAVTTRAPMPGTIRPRLGTPAARDFSSRTKSRSEEDSEEEDSDDSELRVRSSPSASVLRPAAAPLRVPAAAPPLHWKAPSPTATPRKPSQPVVHAAAAPRPSSSLLWPSAGGWRADGVRCCCCCCCRDSHFRL